MSRQQSHLVPALDYNFNRGFASALMLSFVDSFSVLLLMAVIVTEKEKVLRTVTAGQHLPR